MIQLISFLLTAITLSLIIFLVPLGFTRFGKGVIIISSIVLAGFGMLSSQLLPIWQTVLVMLLLCILVTYLLLKNGSGKMLQEIKTQADKPLYLEPQLAMQEVAVTVNEMEEVELDKTPSIAEEEMNEIEDDLIEEIMDEEFLQTRVEIETIEDTELEEDTIPEIPVYKSSVETEADLELDEIELYNELYEMDPRLDDTNDEVEIEELTFTEQKLNGDQK
ncbi:SLC45 family MFS transporter [Bacillus sp. BGMRC 2118]|nr:SLC45 family MFS transporter [Bacillus sp. BGMRC 2118]